MVTIFSFRYNILHNAHYLFHRHLFFLACGTEVYALMSTSSITQRRTIGLYIHDAFTSEVRYLPLCTLVKLNRSTLARHCICSACTIVTLAIPDPHTFLPHHRWGDRTWEWPDTSDRYRLACSDSAAKAPVKQVSGQRHGPRSTGGRGTFPLLFEVERTPSVFPLLLGIDIHVLMSRYALDDWSNFR